MNPALIIFIAALVAVPVVTYRKTGSGKKTGIAIAVILVAWVLLSQFAHQFME
jgi:lipopolysaccharide export LptBFGC system permease protein LptF